MRPGQNQITRLKHNEEDGGCLRSKDEEEGRLGQMLGEGQMDGLDTAPPIVMSGSGQGDP